MIKISRKKFIRIGLLSLAVIGIVVMSYLTYLHYAPGDAFCDIGEGVSCSTVNTSIYSVVLGIPVSIAGLLYFLGVFVAVLRNYNKKLLKNIILLTIVFLGPSLYLTIVEIVIIKSICIFCELAKILMIGIMVFAWLDLRPKKILSKNLIVAVVLAILLGISTYLVHANTGPGEKYNEFAQCLNEKGFKMYGSVTCQSCAKQRAVFGDGFEYIREIECDPRNKGPIEEVELCILKNIKRTPTWIQEDAEGNELYRFGEGFQKLKKLSEVSGCILPEN